MYSYRDKAWLEQKYTGEGLSTVQIADMVECSARTVQRWLQKHDILPRSRSEAASRRWQDAEYRVNWRNGINNWRNGRRSMRGLSKTQRHKLIYECVSAFPGLGINDLAQLLGIVNEHLQSLLPGMEKSGYLLYEDVDGELYAFAVMRDNGDQKTLQNNDR